MIVLHAIWDSTTSGRLHVWAETSTVVESVLPRNKKIARGDQPRLHPFLLSPVMVRETSSALVGDLLVQDAEAAFLTLRFPSTRHGPLASPELVRDDLQSDGQAAELKWWEVATLSFDASYAFDLLLALPPDPPPGIAFGSSLRFWMTAAQFAFELINKQCFVPSLHVSQRGSSSTGRAEWEAVLTPADSQRLRVLAQAMPPVCWAFASPDAKPATFLQELVYHFLNQCIDAFVRESLITQAYVPVKRRSTKTSPLSLSERWLVALTSYDATFVPGADRLTDFATTAHNWLNQLLPATAEAPFRTCFQLVAPGEADDATLWSCTFYLQANDDPSLLIPAETVWQERSSTLTFLQHTFENPQERLLADLGKAARLFPLLEESLTQAHPQSLALSTEQAYTFLRETAPLLEASGYGVLVPPWWQKTSARVGVKLKVRAKSEAQVSSGLLGMDSIVDYSWQVAIGDTELSLHEFEQLVHLKQPLVNVRGQWVELRAEEIEKAIAFFQKKQARRSMSLGDALRVELGEQASDLGLPVVGMTVEGWLADALDRLKQRVPLTPVEIPPTFQGQLRPYQLKGVSWLAFLKQCGFGSCLADDMGLGKTAQLIALLLYTRATSPQTTTLAPTLVICPMSIVGNWQRELERFAPSLSVMVHHGAERLSGDDFTEEAHKHGVVLTTYSLAHRDKAHLSAVEWDTIVIDEAQNIKNSSTKQTQAIKSLQARHKIALTGTPVENRLSEMWSIMEFLNPGYLGSASDFRATFALPIERYRNAERAAMLKNLVQPFLLRRLKTDKAIIQDLPDKMEMNVFCNLTQEQASLYEAVVKEMLQKIEEAEPMERRGLILATLMKLKQICNHPAHFMGDNSSLARRSGKLERLEEMLEEVLAEGDRALIFTQFAEMGSLLRAYLQEHLGCETLFLHGGTSKKQRDLLVQRFQEQRGAQLFILSLKAGGVGLNLTAANHVFHFDRWWNPAVENQATDRAFRIGQKKHVQVHKFVCVGTLEERIDQMIAQKKDLAERIVGSGESWLTEMSTDQLKELFALSREAVGE